MKNLKAVCALSLAGLLLFSLSGCGGEKKETVNRRKMVEPPVKFSANFKKMENGDVPITPEKFDARVNRGTEK